MRLVIVDIDGTLTTGPGTEKRFWAYLLKTGNQGPRQVLAYLGFLVRWSWRYGRQVLKKDKAYLTGLSVSKVRNLADTWVGQVLDDIVYEPSLKRIQQYRSEGAVVILVSGTLDFIATAICESIGAQRAIGSVCAERRGRFRMQPPERHPFAGAKVEIVQELCREFGVGPEHVIALGDSVHDLPLLEFAGQAIAVRPDERLAAIAADRGWEIIGQRELRSVRSLSRNAWPFGLNRGRRY